LEISTNSIPVAKTGKSSKSSWRKLQEAAAAAPAETGMSDTTRDKAIAILARENGVSIRAGQSSATNALTMAIGYAI
jgi:hypothetical protein